MGWLLLGLGSHYSIQLQPSYLSGMLRISTTVILITCMTSCSSVMHVKRVLDILHKCNHHIRNTLIMLRATVGLPRLTSDASLSINTEGNDVTST